MTSEELRKLSAEANESALEEAYDSPARRPKEMLAIILRHLADQQKAESKPAPEPIAPPAPEPIAPPDWTDAPPSVAPTDAGDVVEEAKAWSELQKGDWRENRELRESLEAFNRTEDRSSTAIKARDIISRLIAELEKPKPVPAEYRELLDAAYDVSREYRNHNSTILHHLTAALAAVDRFEGRSQPHA